LPSALVTDMVDQRGDLFERRRELMEAWSRFLAGETAQNVIALAS
jgi:hypothetical protein